MSVETWKDIKGYEGLYQVSNYGQIRALDRIVKDTTKDRSQKIKGHMLSKTDNGRGYKIVILYKNGKRKNAYVHRLVAEHFIENPNSLREVNHKDFDKDNNSVENLEWVSSSENKKHLFNDARGKEKILKSVKTRFKNIINGREKEIIKEYTKNNKTIRIISKEYKLNPATITKLLKMNNIEIDHNRRCHRKNIKKDNKGGNS